jgi:hypothetical protein
MGGLNLGWLGLAPKSWNKKANEFLTGTPEKRENVSTLRPEQEGGYQDLQNAAQGRQSGGAFGQAADYYRGNLGSTPEDYERFAAPEMRNFNEEIIPELSEQFAGMGSGGLSSSGFRNSAVNAGAGLSERLGAIRANLRSQAAQGLQGIGQLGLGNYSQNMVTQQGSQGLLPSLAQMAPHAAAAYATGGASLPASMASMQNQGGVGSGGNYNNPYAGQGGYQR